MKKNCTDLLATSPAALHDHLQLYSPPKLSSLSDFKGHFVKFKMHFEVQSVSSDQLRRTVMCLLSMDPQCTHILNLLYYQKMGTNGIFFIMFFCSFLSRTDMKNTMVRLSL